MAGHVALQAKRNINDAAKAVRRDKYGKQHICSKHNIEPYAAVIINNDESFELTLVHH